MKGLLGLIPGLTALAVGLLVACGGAAPPPPTSAPVATSAPPPATSETGEAIFVGKGGCGACHTIEGKTSGAVGPDLTHIGTDAATRKPGMDARSYIEESIRDPESFVAEGVERAVPGLMTRIITVGLNDAEIELLVDFLSAQK